MRPSVSLMSAALVPATLAVIAFSAPAHAEDRKPSLRIEVDPGMADIAEPNAHSSNVIYMNRCIGGCTLFPGFEDSRSNTSSIINRTVQISEFAHSDAEWDDLVACVRRVYEPFGVVITDQDPGNASHFEAIVAGIDNEIDIEAGGVAPASCGVINNAITYSFANQGSLATMCWTVAQETAHAFGLDHEFLCSDPLTYLTDCGFDKTFQDVDAPCGEFSARGCSCGGSTQNSYRRLRDEFGPGTLTPPTVEVTRPKSGDIVKPNFPIEVAASDDIEVTKVEFLVNGQVVDTLTRGPFIINAPAGLAGRVSVQARAYDNLGTEGSTTSFDVVIDDTLVSFGGECSINSDCETNLCAMSAEGGTCSQLCTPDDDSCPSGSSCISAGTQNVCWPKEGGSSSGSCSAGGPSTLLSTLLLLLGLGWLARRRSSGQLG